MLPVRIALHGSAYRRQQSIQRYGRPFSLPDQVILSLPSVPGSARGAALLGAIERASASLELAAAEAGRAATLKNCAPAWSFIRHGVNSCQTVAGWRGAVAEGLSGSGKSRRRIRL
jgi:hypothetical protein